MFSSSVVVASNLDFTQTVKQTEHDQLSDVSRVTGLWLYASAQALLPTTCTQQPFTIDRLVAELLQSVGQARSGCVLVFPCVKFHA